jgi:hypothetical protein
MPAAVDEAPRATFGGADAFMFVLDREIRRAGLSGFNSFILLKLKDRPDADALRAALASDLPLARAVRTPLRRTFPLARLSRVAEPGSSPPRVDVLSAPPAGEAAPWPSLLNARLAPERGENVRFTLFPVPGDGWRAAFLFSHLLADAKAAERMLVRLDDGGGASWPDPRSLLGGMKTRDVALAARAQVNALAGDRTGPLHVVGAGAPSGGCAGASVALDEEETKAAVAVGRRAAGYAMEGLWYLASALAAERDTDASSAPDGARYAVALPTSLDRKDETRALGNNLVFLFLGAPVGDARDPVALTKRFRERMLAHLRDRADRRSQAQMDLCRLLPAPVHSWLARRTMGGGWGSLFFTNPGPVAPGLTRFFGAEILDVDHFPIPSPSPGVCAVVWTFGGRLHLGVTWLTGLVPDERARAFLARWRVRVTQGTG